MHLKVNLRWVERIVSKCAVNLVTCLKEHIRAVARNDLDWQNKSDEPAKMCTNWTRISAFLQPLSRLLLSTVQRRLWSLKWTNWCYMQLVCLLRPNTLNLPLQMLNLINLLIIWPEMLLTPRADMLHNRWRLDSTLGAQDSTRPPSLGALRVPRLIAVHNPRKLWTGAPKLLATLLVGTRDIAIK